MTFLCKCGKLPKSQRSVRVHLHFDFHMASRHGSKASGFAHTGTAPAPALALVLVLVLILALGPQPCASAPCGRPALARTQQPFVLFGAMPLVGHLTPLVMQALELKGRGTARRVVATTMAFVGSPHGEILEVLAAAAPSTVEFIEAGALQRL
jgi:hypothetical protein